MAFDGITIANIAQELNQTIVGGKIKQDRTAKETTS